MSKSTQAVVHPYQGQDAVLTTKHRKLRLISPFFEKKIGLKIFEADLDTDLLGTFAGEVPRKYPPIETAILKAKLGMEATGLSIGIASEGSIGSDQFIPFIISDVEHIVLVDAEREIVIRESFRSFDITALTITVTPGQDLSDFVVKADFPNHKLIARPNFRGAFLPIKGISSLYDLLRAVELCGKESPDGSVIVESDLRAHNSPSRQKNIEAVASLLASRVSELCVVCHTPGWGRIGYLKGLRCTLCTNEIPEAIRQEIMGCSKCSYSESGKVVAEIGNPATCPHCNP
ncbi:MAG: hypothetical protein H7227_08605 [Actinobacteria bacterium]|nr:hypothetical protein [Actinomycetota bacterium]